METMNSMTVATPGTESRGDQLAMILASQAGLAVNELERTLEFLGADYVRPGLSDPKQGLARLRHCLSAHPERLEAIREDAKRFRFEAFEAAYNALLARVQEEIELAFGHIALSGLYTQLERLAADGIRAWNDGQRRQAIGALRAAMRGVDRAYSPLRSSGFNGKGSRSQASRKGKPNPNRKPLKAKGGRASQSKRG